MKTIVVTALLIFLSVGYVNSLTAKQFASKLISLYNEESYSDIVAMFGTKYQSDAMKKMIIQNLTDTHDAYGDILTNITVSSTSRMMFQMITFKNDLSMGALVVVVEKNKAIFGTVAAVPNTSFVDFVDRNSDNLAFKFIFDDATISKNDGDSYGVEALQILPVTIEYCNQLAQGKLKSSRSVSSKDVKKYYIEGQDGHYSYFQLSYKKSQTLGSLVLQNLKTPSLAVSEYLVDLLGLENIKDTMSSLGISQDRTMYPASHFVYMAVASASYKGTNFISKVEDLSDSDLADGNEMFHQILKAGNSSSTNLINTAVTQLKKRLNSTFDAINIKNTVGTAGGYAEALYSLINKDFSLDGKTNSIYNSFMAMASSSSGSSESSSSSLLPSGKSLSISGNSLEGSEEYQYGSMAAFSVPKKSNFKKLAFSFFASGSLTQSDDFSTNFFVFLINVMTSPEYRQAASSAL